MVSSDALPSYQLGARRALVVGPLYHGLASGGHQLASWKYLRYFLTYFHQAGFHFHGLVSYCQADAGQASGGPCRGRGLVRCALQTAQDYGPQPPHEPKPPAPPSMVA